jgi:N-acetylglutamate synthase-like GNAT family acetyltransferase
MRIRNYTADDIDVCRSLWAEMVQRHRDIYKDQTIGGDDPGLEFDKHVQLVGSDNTWLVESEGNVIGFTSLIRKKQEAEIEPIVISNEHRGKGVGKLLVEHAVEEAKKQGILCLYVRPVARNKEAISFFRDCGFRIVGHIQLFMWFGESSRDTWREGLEIFGKSFEY